MANIRKNDNLLELFGKIARNIKASMASIAAIETNLGGRIAHVDRMPPNSAVKMVWSGRFACIVTIQGTTTATHASYLVQGYGASTARLHVARVQGGEAITHVVSSTEQAVTFANVVGGTDAVVSVMMLQGGLPRISQ